jgi:taurine--2-oxoglutarate transaminase
VNNRDTKEPFSVKVMAEVKKTLLDNGLFTFIMVKDIGTMIFVVPPLCITKEQLDEGLSLVEKALDVVDKQVK